MKAATTLRVITTAIILFSCLVANAQVRLQNLNIQANEFNRDFENKTVSLKGDVIIQFDGQSIVSDEATIYLNESRITTNGPVILSTADFFAQGSNLEYNYKTNLGHLEKGYIKSGQVIFEGELIEKIGEKEFVAEDATYTACASCPPAWSFSGARIEAEIGGYAYIKLPVLRVVDFPIFFLPSILVPLKSTRQSGLLIPSWGKEGDGGLTISQSYFLAINRNTDATFSLKNYEYRGLKYMAEYRYVLSSDSQGQINFAFLNDSLFKEQNESLGNVDPNNDIKINNTKRWFTKYDHIYQLPNGYSQKTQLNLVSDLRYARDFPQEIPGHGNPALENRVSLSKSQERQFSSLEVDFYMNLLNTDPKTDNTEAVHRMPEIKHSFLMRPVFGSGLYFKMDTEFVNFFRTGYSFDDVANSGGDPSITFTTNDGVFDPNQDILRTGARIDLIPSLSYPLHVSNYLRILPSISFRQTHYTFYADTSIPGTDYKDKTFRQYLQMDLKLSTELSRIYKGFNLFESDSSTQTLYKHKIEPLISYSNIPYKLADSHPFFGDFQNTRADSIDDPIVESDFWDPLSTNCAGNLGCAKVQFDYKDRLFNYHVVNIGVTNRIVRKRWEAGTPKYKNIGTFGLYQFYDLNEKNRNKTIEQPLSPLNALLDIRLDRFETNTTAKYHPYANVTDISSRLKWLDDIGNYLQLSFNRANKLTDDLQDVPDQLDETFGLGIGYASRVFNLFGEVIYSNNTSEIQSWQYVTEFVPIGSCWSILFGQKQIFGKSSPDLKLNISFDFGGDEIKK